MVKGSVLINYDNNQILINQKEDCLEIFFQNIINPNELINSLLMNVLKHHTIKRLPFCQGYLLVILFLQNNKINYFPSN